MNPKLTVPETLVKEVCQRLGLNETATLGFVEVALQNAILFDMKQRDYGPRNMSAFGSFGVIVRASDKFERLKHLFNNRRSHATNESIEDSFRDISNYANIALMLESGKWPGYVPTDGEPRRPRPPSVKKKTTITTQPYDKQEKSPNNPP
jgi:hypothetical protein